MDAVAKYMKILHSADFDISLRFIVTIVITVELTMILYCTQESNLYMDID